MVNSVEIRKMMKLCSDEIDNLKDGQYKNGSYSSHSGNEARRTLSLLYLSLSSMYEEVKEEEIRQKVLKELGFIKG